MNIPVYSVIIPHYNSPDLLVRTINSVPNREDTEVIVVDNSPASIEASQLTGVKRPYQLLYSSKTLGAGCARNVGLNNARGKYIIFMDADDMLTQEANTILNEFAEKHDVPDITYFRTRSVYSDTLKPSSRADLFNKHLDNYLKSPSDLTRERLTYYHLTPWAKIYKRSAIDKANARFDEVPASNDLMFATRVAISTTDIEADTRCLYVVTAQTKGTLTTSPNAKNIRSRHDVVLRQSKLFGSVGKLQYSSLPTVMLKALLKCSIKDFCWGLCEIARQHVNPVSIICSKIKHHEFK